LPLYEYRCGDCGKKFDVLAGIAEKEAGLKPGCPKCGSRDCRQVFGRVTVITSSKSEGGFDDDMPDDELDGSADLDGGQDDLDAGSGLDDLD